MENKPILTPDTNTISGISNAPDWEDQIVRLASRFQFRLTFTSISELVATQDMKCRSKLGAVCKRLLESGDCIDPQDKIMEKMVAQFERPEPFDWKSVDVGLPEARQVILNGVPFTDEDSAKQLEENKEAKAGFKRYLSEIQPPAKIRISSLDHWIMQLKTSGTFYKMASKLYTPVSRNPWDVATVESFVNQCPPFHALMVALCAARYARYFKPQQRRSIKAGPLDTFMAICLPYCDSFVTDDRDMWNCFNEVTQIVGLDTEIVESKELGLRLPGDACQPRVAAVQAV